MADTRAARCASGIDEGRGLGAAQRISPPATHALLSGEMPFGKAGRSSERQQLIHPRVHELVRLPQLTKDGPDSDDQRRESP
jgi:hypothetical protein